MTHPIRNPKARKVQVGISLSLSTLEIADAIATARNHPTRSALVEELIREAAGQLPHPREENGRTEQNRRSNDG